MIPNFESFLQERHMALYPEITKDRWEGHFENWLSELDTQDVIDYAEMWGEHLKSYIPAQ